MTNGEKFMETFAISQVGEGELYAYAWLPNYDVPAEFIIDWWNAEYKAKGFLSKFNKIIKTVTPQEPTDKNFTKADIDAIADCCETAFKCIELLQYIKGNGCHECKLCVNDGGRRCRIQSPPYNFVDGLCDDGCFKTCPIQQLTQREGKQESENKE